MPSNKVKSKVWQYFKKGDNSLASCKICNKVLKTSGNTSNLRGHIEKVHSQHLTDDTSTNLPEPLPKQTRLEFVTSANPDTQTTAGNESDPILPLSPIAGPSTSGTVANQTEQKVKMLQPNVDDFFDRMRSVSSKDGVKSKKVTEAIVNFIVLDNKPFSTVEGKGFLRLMKEVLPLYKVPTRETIKTRIDEKYEAMAIIFKSYLQKVEHCCLT